MKCINIDIRKKAGEFKYDMQCDICNDCSDVVVKEMDKLLLRNTTKYIFELQKIKAELKLKGCKKNKTHWVLGEYDSILIHKILIDKKLLYDMKTKKDTM